MVCSKCKQHGVWIEYGPRIGAGWYCRHCKDDIYHTDNVYGSSGQRYIASLSKPTFNEVWKDINCTLSCKVCHGRNYLVDNITLKPGDKVKAILNSGVSKSLISLKEYTISQVDSSGIRVQEIPNSVGYARCRFRVKHVSI